jgi:hypothetical protein
MRWEAMKILPWRWSIRWEKRFVMARRRPSSAEGRLAGGSSGIWSEGTSGSGEGDALSDNGWEETFEEGGGGGFGESAKSRL